MTSAIGNGTDGVGAQQRVAQLQTKIAAGPDALANSPSANGGVSRAAELFASDGSNKASDKLTKLAGALGIDESALLSALKSGDPTRVTNLITSSSLSKLTGAEAAADPTAALSGGNGASTPEMPGISALGGDTGAAGVQSQLASLGRTGLQFDGKL